MTGEILLFAPSYISTPFWSKRLVSCHLTVRTNSKSEISHSSSDNQRERNSRL